MIVDCDFDGVICQHEKIPSETTIDNLKPVKQSKEAIKWLQKKHLVYVLTNRPAGQVVPWLVKNGFKGLVVTDKKLPETKMIIDDRAIRFISWSDTCKLLG